MESKRLSSFDEASATHSPAVTSGTPARSAETAPIEAAATAPVDAAPEEPASTSFPLIATASGLLAAILALAIYTWLSHRANAIIAGIEYTSSMYLALVGGTHDED